MDWGLAATALALGFTPLGVPAVEYYSRNVVVPRMPDSVVDVGLLFTPNFELLYELKPDLIVIPSELESARPSLERICATLAFSLRDRQGASYEQARRATLQIAAALDRENEGAALIARARQAMDEARARLSAGSIMPVSFVDARHVAIFGREACMTTRCSSLVSRMVGRALRASVDEPSRASKRWGQSRIRVSSSSKPGGEGLRGKASLDCSGRLFPLFGPAA